MRLVEWPKWFAVPEVQPRTLSIRSRDDAGRRQCDVCLDLSSSGELQHAEQTLDSSSRGTCTASASQIRGLPERFSGLGSGDNRATSSSPQSLTRASGLGRMQARGKIQAMVSLVISPKPLGAPQPPPMLVSHLALVFRNRLRLPSPSRRRPRFIRELRPATWMEALGRAWLHLPLLPCP